MEDYLRERYEALRSERAQAEQIQERISNLEDDLKSYRDVQRLQTLGSDIGLYSSEETCPTCHQLVSSELLPVVSESKVLPIDENVGYIESQKNSLTTIKEGLDRRVDLLNKEVTSIQERASVIRDEIRQLREDITEAGSGKSEAKIREQIQIKTEISRLRNAEERIWQAVGGLEPIAHEFRKVVAQRELLPAEDLSADDKKKLAWLSENLREQAEEYHFRSFNPALLQASEETYRPSREGYDIGFEASTSDNIRLIWAYLNGLLEMARVFDTNHLGLLILDEPKQQDAELPSFTEFTERVVAAREYGQQVVLASSEEPEEIEDLYERSDLNLVDYKGKILQEI